MNSLLGNAKIGSQPGGRPPAAVEIAPEGVLAAALPGNDPAPVYAYEPLPQGALVPGLTEPNLRAPRTVETAIRSALGQVSPRTRAVTLVLPDTVVRVFVLDFDSLPSRAVEAYPVLRFRLRKMVSFDVEHAGLSYQILTESKTECKVLAAVIPGPILAEYEAAARAAGYEPGAVLSSSLAALETGGSGNSMEAVLGANLSGVALTTFIANGNDLMLYRTLDLPEDAGLRMHEVRRGIAVASAYFEDKLQARPGGLYFAGLGTAAEFSSYLDEPDLPVIELAPRPEAGVLTSLGQASIAGVAGALAGAR